MRRATVGRSQAPCLDWLGQTKIHTPFSSPLRLGLRILRWPMGGSAIENHAKFESPQSACNESGGVALLTR